MPKQSFIKWFNTKRFRNFGALEFTRYFGRSRYNVRNSEPPRHLWENIVPALRIVDDLRDSFGSPCVLLSSYRSPDYNRAVGGASRSQHVQFTALDIRIQGVTPQRVYERLLQWRREGRFRGGLGLYPSAGFVHIDTRGTNSTWRGR